MKNPRIVAAIGHIDDDLISGAAESKKKNRWLKWTGVAACITLLCVAAAVILPSWLADNEKNTGKYDKQLVAQGETDIEWPWEYKTNAEKYGALTFNGKRFRVKSLRPVTTACLGETLGTCQAEGVDIYTDQTYTESFEVRRLHGVSEERLVAVGNETGFYVYAADDTTKPATFGQVLDLYGLPQNLEFSRYQDYEGYDSNGYFVLNDGAYIWQILSECRNAPLYENEDSFDRGQRNYLSFTATSDALGVYKRVVYISKDGYFATNIFDYSHTYYIGEEAAGAIIDYARENSVKAEPEQYALSVAGTLVEIGEGYVLIDDSVLCADPKDGTVYKVYTDDFRMARCLAFRNLQVGDTVGVKYEGSVSKNNEISGAYEIYKGTLIDGDLAVPE